MVTSFENAHRVGVVALLVGKRIDLRALYRSDSLAVAPLAIPAGERGMAVLFRYGAVVMFNLQVVEEAAFLLNLKNFVGDQLAEAEREDAEIAVDPDADERVDVSGVVRLREITSDRLLVVADVAEALQQERGGRVVARQLLDHIGDVLITQHRMVGRVEVTEKPELLWDRPELERLYLRLQEEYELPERDRALTRKLDLIAQTASTALGLLQAKRSLRVEWYIVLLIVVEIILTLYEMFVARFL